MAEKQAFKPVKIVMTADGVYLPLDADGNCFAWEGDLNYTCIPVPRRTRLLTHPDMAKSLQAADKAEILDG
jgi:hypothetical protein